MLYGKWCAASILMRLRFVQTDHFWDTIKLYLNFFLFIYACHVCPESRQIMYLRIYVILFAGHIGTTLSLHLRRGDFVWQFLLPVAVVTAAFTIETLLCTNVYCILPIKSRILHRNTSLENHINHCNATGQLKSLSYITQWTVTVSFTQIS